MTSNLPESIIERLREKKVIPFVGAGVSMSITDQLGEKVFPSWFELLSRSENALNAEKKTKAALEVNDLLTLPVPDYYQTAKIAKAAMGQRWYRFLQAQLNPQMEQIDTKSLALAQAIWKIGNPFIITTNYDRSLFWTCPNQNDFTYWDIENVVGKGQLLSTGLPRKPTVWHLHGHIDNPERIILTLDGYLKLYPGKRRKIEYEASLATLRSIMTGYSLLFIGFSMNDTFINEQLIYVNNLYKDTIGPHYILTCENDLARIEAKNLPVNPITFSDYGMPLINKINEIAAIANDKSDITLEQYENPPAAKTLPKAIKRPIYQALLSWIIAIFIGLGFFGAILLLWIPRIVDYYRLKVESKTPSEMERVEPAKGAGNQNQSPSDTAQTPEATPENKTTTSPQTDSFYKSETSKPEKSAAPVKEKSVTAQPIKPIPEVWQSTARAQSLYNQRKYNEAIDECNKILAKQPGNKAAISLRARIKKTVEILNP